MADQAEITVTKEPSTILPVLKFLGESMKCYQQKLIDKLNGLKPDDPLKPFLEGVLMKSGLDLIALINPSITPVEAGEIMVGVTDKIRKALGESKGESNPDSVENL